MFRLKQIIQNTFLRIFGFFQRLFTNFFSFLSGFFGGLAKVLGLTETGRFLEFEDAQGLKAREVQQPETPSETPRSTTGTVRRRPDPNMDYFRNLAREIKTSDRNPAS